mmetsp:Transcript_32279/g.77355  ORF Transcript_32279/g.77355 Transcript_32279/m.77355 type:complete len:209 (+) Transcript_32279:2060-2686(+)
MSSRMPPSKNWASPTSMPSDLHVFSSMSWAAATGSGCARNRSKTFSKVGGRWRQASSLKSGFFTSFGASVRPSLRISAVFNAASARSRCAWLSSDTSDVLAMSDSFVSSTLWSPGAAVSVGSPSTTTVIPSEASAPALSAAVSDVMAGSAFSVHGTWSRISLLASALLDTGITGALLSHLLLMMVTSSYTWPEGSAVISASLALGPRH